MNPVLVAILKREPVTDDMIEEWLFEICDETHAQCHESCPIFALNLGGGVNGCDYHKKGGKMLKTLREQLNA